MQLKTFLEKEKLLFWSNFTFNSHNVLKSRLMQMRQNASSSWNGILTMTTKLQTSEVGFLAITFLHRVSWNLVLLYCE